MHPRRESGVAQRECGYGSKPSERTQGRASRKLGTLLDSEEDRHGTGSERQPREPAAYAGAPASPGQRHGADEQRRQDQLGKEEEGRTVLCTKLVEARLAVCYPCCGLTLLRFRLDVTRQRALGRPLNPWHTSAA
jgi:hypothetical protein